MSNLRADEDHEDEVRDWLRRKKLGHLRVRRRAETLTLELGPREDPIPHLRLRRVSVHLWTVECATHTGRFEPTFLRDQLDKVLSEVDKNMPWVLAPAG
jgi:hypothetical protein